MQLRILTFFSIVATASAAFVSARSETNRYNTSFNMAATNEIAEIKVGGTYVNIGWYIDAFVAMISISSLYGMWIFSFVIGAVL